MEYKIRNKWITLGGSSYITDMADNHIYEVKGNIFTFTHKKRFYDKNGKLLFIIRNKFWRLFTRRAFIINPENKQIICRISKKFLSLRSKFTVDRYPEEIVLDGNILDFNFRVTKNGADVGHVARRVSLRDSFVLTIDDSEDQAFFCALVIAIDCILDRRNQEGSSVSFSSGD